MQLIERPVSNIMFVTRLLHLDKINASSVASC